MFFKSVLGQRSYVDELILCLSQIFSPKFQHGASYKFRSYEKTVFALKGYCCPGQLIDNFFPNLKKSTPEIEDFGYKCLARAKS